MLLSGLSCIATVTTNIAVVETTIQATGWIQSYP